MFGLYEIRVDGIEDLQFRELASRSFSKKHVNGLAKCIERDSTIPFVERRRWQVVKDNGKNLFDPQLGGSYAVFDQRPLSKDIKEYCTQDVTFMPYLREVYRRKLCDALWSQIETETDERVQLSQSPTFRANTWPKAAPVRELVRHYSLSLPSRGVVRSMSDDGGELVNMICHVTLMQTKRFLDEPSDDDFVHGQNSTQGFHGDDCGED
ncbi:hypothetical protein LTR49_028752 [Elasticomyces elasticus]|nr:hypothetical protein LTR49_028752 [Elasticomyces elasticus]